MARIRAVKVLDYAMSTSAGTANCYRFVESLGLKTLFPMFMRKVCFPSHNTSLLNYFVELKLSLSSVFLLYFLRE